MALLPISRAIIIPQAVQAGTAVSVVGVRDIFVTIIGAFNATLSIQHSQDGVNWLDTITGITAAGSYQVVLQKVVQLRFNTTAYVNGTPTATIDGYAGSN